MSLDALYTVCNSLVDYNFTHAFQYPPRFLGFEVKKWLVSIGNYRSSCSPWLSFEDDSYLPVALACLQTTFNVVDISGDHEKLVAAVYLQVSILSQALIFVTRSQSWSIFERPGFLLMLAFVGAQMVRFTWKMVHFSSITLANFLLW
jgi:hypothetical protein